MELSTLTPELPQLLADMGVRYDPERLADALGSRPTGAAAFPFLLFGASACTRC